MYIYFYICIFIPITILIGSEIISTSVEKYEENMLGKYTWRDNEVHSIYFGKCNRNPKFR